MKASVRVITSFVLVLTLLVSSVPASVRGQEVGPAAVVLAAGRGNPYVNLDDGFPLDAAYDGPEEALRALREGQLRPRSLTAADFDGDGVPDLVAGYADAAGKGLLTLHRGNVDSIYPNAPGALKRKAAGTFTDAPFLSPARAFLLPVAPDFLGAGDFDNDGCQDVVLAERGGTVLYLLPGDGGGGFAPPRITELPGGVTALAVGEINRRDGLSDIVVGIGREHGEAAVLVFEGPQGALRQKPEVIPVPAAVTALALGALDDEFGQDLAVAAGSDLFLVHGRDRRLYWGSAQQAGVAPPVVERHALPSPITALAAGSFTLGEGYPQQIALLTADGVLRLLAPATFDTQWTMGNVYFSMPNPQLFRVRVSSLPTDDLLLLDPARNQLHILLAPQSPDSPTPGQVTLDAVAAPLAALPMRLNKDALSDLVLLTGAGPVVAPTAPLAHFYVNTSGDDADDNQGDGICHTAQGTCTLRAAIQEANAHTGADEIDFNSIVAHIIPNSPLPDSTEALTIDGTTNALNDHLVYLEGQNAGLGISGLTIGSSSVVRGMVVSHFRFDGVGGGFGVAIDGSNSIVEGNILGTVDGSTNGNEAAGVVAATGAANNIIGGSVYSVTRNILSGNQMHGVQIGEPTGPANNNRIIGNYIGLNREGSATAGNGQAGVIIAAMSSANTVEDNVISGNTICGISIQDAGTGNAVWGNKIGTDAAGLVPIPNGVSGMGGNGVQIVRTSGSSVGGTTENERNVIAGNYGSGVAMWQPTTAQVAPWSAQGDLPSLVFARTPAGSPPPALPGAVQATENNIVAGNYIGVKADASGPLGNDRFGVVITNGSSNTVGGIVENAGNVISDNGYYGVAIAADGGTAIGNTVSGNRIGTDPTGNVVDPDALPGTGDEWNNGLDGVYIRQASYNLIGGTEAYAANVIGGNMHGVYIEGAGAQHNQVQGNRIGEGPQMTDIGNQRGGVFLTGGTSDNFIGGDATGEGNIIAYNGGRGVVVESGTRNRIVGNAIFSNERLAIDLGDDYVTLNDFQDADSGANDLQNYPEITAFSGTTISGTLSAKPLASYAIDFYAYRACRTSLSGFGAAHEYLGRLASLSTDDKGEASFVWNSPRTIPSGYAVSATATDANGNTSEISNQPYQLHASSPNFIPSGTLNAPHKILLWTTIHPILGGPLQNCPINYDLKIVVDGDTAHPLSLVNDGKGLTDRRYADFHTGDVHYSTWFTPTTNTSTTLELYLVPFGEPLTSGLLSDKLVLEKADKPELVVLTDLRELFTEFNRTTTNSATADKDGNKALDYYDALERIFLYAQKHAGIVIDVRQSAYSADHDYAAGIGNLGKRAQMGEEIDRDLIQKLKTPYQSSLKYVAIIGDDAVVPFTRYGINYTKSYDESTYGLAKHPDGNPTLADIAYTGSAAYQHGAMMSDVPYGTFGTGLANYVVPDLAVGRIFYVKPLDLVKAIDAYEKPADLRASHSTAVSFFISDEYRTKIVNGQQTQVLWFPWVGIFNQGYRPHFVQHYGASNIQDYVPVAQMTFPQGKTYLYNGIGNYWELFAPWNNANVSWVSQSADVLVMDTHANHLSFYTEAQKRKVTSAQSVTAADFGALNAAVVTTPGCHAGLSVAYQQTHTHHYYEDSLVLAMLKRHTAYFAPTTFGGGDMVMPTLHDLFIPQFIKSLFTASHETMGKAYIGAFSGYKASATSYDWPQYVPYSMAFYGLPTQPLTRDKPQTAAHGPTVVAVNAPLAVQSPVTATETLSITHFALDYDASGAARIELPAQGTLTAEDFGPFLPVVHRTYPLPLAATNVTVSLLHTESHPYSIPLDLQTAAPVIFSYGPLTGTFTATNPYPLSIMVSGTYTTDGALNVALSLIPLQYNPDTRQVTLVDRMDYQITYQAPTTVTVDDLALNGGQDFDTGTPTVPLTLTLTSQRAMSVTLVWAVENGDGLYQDNGVAETALLTGTTQVGWNLDATGWQPGSKHLWVAVQDPDGEVLASGWTDFFVRGETLSLDLPTTLVASDETETELRAVVRDETGAGLTGRAGDLHLWLNGVPATATWHEGADGTYTTTVPLNGFSEGVVFSATLNTTVFSPAGPLDAELRATDALLIDSQVPTSTVRLTTTIDTIDVVEVSVDAWDDTGVSEITVEYQVDGGQWHEWQTFSPAYEATIQRYFGDDGPLDVDLTVHRYCFRSQASDGVGNQEALHPQADVCTSLVSQVYLPLVYR